MEEGAPHGSPELHNIVLQRFKLKWIRGISASLDIIMCHLFHEVSRAQKWSRMWRSTWFCEVELCHVARKGCCFGVLTVLTVFADKLLVFEWTAFKTQPHGYSDRNTGSSQRFSVSNHSTQEDKSPAIEIAPHGQQAELGARCLKWQLLELGSCVFASRKASAATRQKAEEAAERMLMQHARFKPLEDSG